VPAGLVPADRCLGYGFDSPGAAVQGRDFRATATGSTFRVLADGGSADVSLAAPGRHNASNALAAIAAARALNVPLAEAADALARFEGLKRRLELVGETGGIAVYDDFAHNPDKVAATLAALRLHPGRLLLLFQPHGYGPLAKMGDQLARALAEGMASGDQLFLPDPVYQGGTVDRSRGSDWLAEKVRGEGALASHIADRAAAAEVVLAEARSGDRIVVMGARDDTLTEVAQDLLDRLRARG
jgi:UDP-N-acetylmuramate--alanine ligase